MSQRVDVVFHFSSHSIMKSLLTVSLLLVVGCASESPYEGVVFTRHTKEAFPPTQEVEVFPQDADRAYTIIGELKMTFSAELSDEEMVNQMKEVSRGIGADAIIGFKKEEVEIPIPGVFHGPLKRKARHQPLEISSPEATEEGILLRGLIVRYQ